MFQPRIQPRQEAVPGLIFLQLPLRTLISYHLAGEVKDDEPVAAPSSLTDYTPAAAGGAAPRQGEAIWDTIAEGVSLPRAAAIMDAAQTWMLARQLVEAPAAIADAMRQHPAGTDDHRLDMLVLLVNRAGHTVIQVHPSELQWLQTHVSPGLALRAGRAADEMPLAYPGKAAIGGSRLDTPGRLGTRLICPPGLAGELNAANCGDTVLRADHLRVGNIDAVITSRLRWDALHAYTTLLGDAWFRDIFTDTARSNNVGLQVARMRFRAAVPLYLIALQPALLAHYLSKRALSDPHLTRLIHRYLPQLDLDGPWAKEDELIASIPVAPWVNRALRWFGTSSRKTPLADDSHTVTLPPYLYSVLFDSPDPSTRATGGLHPHRLITNGAHWATATTDQTGMTAGPSVRAQLLAAISNPELREALTTVGRAIGYGAVTNEVFSFDLWNQKVVHSDTLHTDSAVSLEDAPSVILVDPRPHVTRDLAPRVIVPEAEDRLTFVPRNRTLMGDADLTQALDPRQYQPMQLWRHDREMDLIIETTPEGLGALIGVRPLDVAARIQADAEFWRHIVGIRRDNGTLVLAPVQVDGRDVTHVYRSLRTLEARAGWLGTYLEVPYVVPSSVLHVIEDSARGMIPSERRFPVGYQLATYRGAPTDVVGYSDETVPALGSRIAK